MVEDFRKLVEQISDPLDLATVLVFGTGGFLLDAGLNAVGFLEPGYVGITAASGALGFKKAIEAAWVSVRRRKDREWLVVKEGARASKLLELLRSKEHRDLARQLERDLELYEASIIDIENLQDSLERIIKSYRSRDEKLPESSNVESQASDPAIMARFSTLETEIDSRE